MIDLSVEYIAALQGLLKPRLSKYVPYSPTPKQLAFLLMNEVREVLYGGAAGGGKDLDIRTEIRTYNRGWQTMETVEVGDYVVDENGGPTKVVWKSEVMHNKCYKLTVGKEEIVAGKDHEWVVHRRRQDRKERIVETQTTEQLFNRFQKNAPKNRGSLYALPTCSMQGQAKELLLDPYVLGAWLGDGCVRSGNMSTVEPEMMEEFERLGYDTYITPSSIKHDRPDLHPDGRFHHWCSQRLRDELYEMGFLGCDDRANKEIPVDYMEASYEQRLALLQGLMDTDGCAVDRPTGDVELTLANKYLAYQCEELIKSLGIKVNCRHSVDRREDPRYPKGEYHRYRMNWTTGLPMFRLQKLIKQAKETPNLQKWHYISNIEEVETVPTQCIQVENPTHLYLVTKSLIPTHNSIAQMMAALQYVDVPGYSAILFRKTYADLALPGALLSIAKDWLLGHKEIHWSDKEKKFTFPSSATLAFGYLENENDCYRYQGAEFQYIGFDECTHIAPSNYRYLHSRLRKPKALLVPLRFRATANPGGQYGEYYHNRFFVDKGERIFVGAGIHDNPHLDAEEYMKSLDELDPVTREQLLNGNWEIREAGNLFAKDWFQVVTSHSLPAARRRVRYWDMASTEATKKKTKSKDPDYTVGLLLSEHQGIYWIEDIVRVQKSPLAVETLIKEMAKKDGYATAIRMEQEPGSSGVITVDHYARNVLKGYNFQGIRSTGSKVERAGPVSAAAQSGRVLYTDTCRNITALLDESEIFPFGPHDDTVDGLSGAFNYYRCPVVMRAPKSITKGSSYWRKGMRNAGQL